MSSTGLVLAPSTAEDPFVSFLQSKGKWCPQLSTESILIFLSVAGSSAVPMRVLESDSIASVKLRVQSCTKGFMTRNRKLVFDGRELARKDSLVKDYGMVDGDVIHLAVRLSDLRKIAVETVLGEKFVLQVEQSRTVGYIKREVAKRVGVLGGDGEHRLFFDDQELEDRTLVTDISNNDGAVIHLLIRRSAEVETESVDTDFQVSVVAVAENSVEDGLQIAFGRSVEPIIVNPRVEISTNVKNMIRAADAGLEKGNMPAMSAEGTSGVYFMPDSSGQNYVAVFKPIDEEPMAENNPRGLPLSKDGNGLKKGTRVGEGALREVAAYVLDYPACSSSGSRCRSCDSVGFSGVPPTVLVQCAGNTWPASRDRKIGSLQMFVKNSGSCEDVGPSAFPVLEVHKIALLDIRLANADRHAGNMLIRKQEDGRVELVPIDHGYCLPESFEDCTFEWLYWPQSRQPFSPETLDYIRTLDADEDISVLSFYGWDLSPESARVLRVSTMLLRKSATRGLTAYDIGGMMCRESVRKESKIEEILRAAEDAVLPGTGEAAFLDAVSDAMDLYLHRLSTVY